MVRRKLRSPCDLARADGLLGLDSSVATWPAAPDIDTTLMVADQAGDALRSGSIQEAAELVAYAEAIAGGDISRARIGEWIIKQKLAPPRKLRRRGHPYQPDRPSKVVRR